MDPSGVSADSRNAYVGSETIDISTADHTFARPVRNIVVHKTGDVKVEFLDGTQQVFEITVANNDYTFLIKDGKGAMITKVIKSGTTSTEVDFGLF